MMLEGHTHPGPGRSIGTGLVGDHYARRAGWLSYQLAQELVRCALTLSALKEGVQNKAVSIDGANMALHLAVDRDHDLVEMLLVAELQGAPTDLAGVDPSERLCPAPHGFVADSWLTIIPRCQQVLDHPQAERKAEIEPDSLLDDYGREPVAAINGSPRRDHRARRAHIRRHFVKLTAPTQRINQRSRHCRQPYIDGRTMESSSKHLSPRISCGSLNHPGQTSTAVDKAVQLPLKLS
jgi:hypothetical protein